MMDFVDTLKINRLPCLVQEQLLGVFNIIPFANTVAHSKNDIHWQASQGEAFAALQIA